MDMDSSLLIKYAIYTEKMIIQNLLLVSFGTYSMYIELVKCVFMMEECMTNNLRTPL